jgi:hypothetical protein
MTRPWLPGDPDPGGEPIPCAEVVAPTVDLAAENAQLKQQVADLQGQVAALSENDLQASQQLMAVRTERDRLLSRIAARDAVADQVAEANIARNHGLDKSDL